MRQVTSSISFSCIQVRYSLSHESFFAILLVTRTIFATANRIRSRFYTEMGLTLRDFDMRIVAHLETGYRDRVDFEISVLFCLEVSPLEIHYLILHYKGHQSPTKTSSFSRLAHRTVKWHLCPSGRFRHGRDLNTEKSGATRRGGRLAVGQSRHEPLRPGLS